MSPLLPRTSRTTGPLSLLVALVAGGVALGLLRDRGEGVEGPPPDAGGDPELFCTPGEPGCRPAGGASAAAAPATELAASRVCYSAGYLCDGLEEGGEIRVVRWNDDTGQLRIRVPRPDVADPTRARRLQEAAARGIRAWHERPFPIRVDLSDREGSHHFVVRWTPSLGGRELGRTRTRWVRKDGRADLAVEDFALATNHPWDAAVLLPPEQVALTAAHEMGHALGLPHSGEARDVMYPENTATRLTARDYTTMSALYELENGAVVR